jgi:hypothetical protein
MGLTCYRDLIGTSLRNKPPHTLDNAARNALGDVFVEGKESTVFV